MQTKEKILATALALYNDRGINVITSRHIAAGMGISPGNLHYHFKHTDDIIKGLYDILANEFEQLMVQAQQTSIVHFDALKVFSVYSVTIAYNYRFFFLNFVDIVNRIPFIKQHYKQIVIRRKKEFKKVFTKLTEAGVFRSDIPESIWDALVIQIFIVADHWLAENEGTRQLKGNQAIKYYANILDALFYPYLAKP
jgi:AcrR family transcriptional regulator